MKHVIKLALPYEPDSATLFNHIKDDEWPIWLDSGTNFPGHHIDIMAASPSDRLIFDPQNTIASQTNQLPNLEAAFSKLETTLEQNTHAESYGPGWIGFLSYDLYDQFEDVKKRLKHEAIPQMIFGFYGYTLVNDHKNQQTYILSLPEKEKEARALLRKISNDSAQQNKPVIDNDYFKLLTSFKPTTTKEEYANQFNKVKRYIVEGDCYQVNLTQQFKAKCTGNGLHAFEALRSLHSSPMSAYFKVENFEILSLSPERFIKADQRHISTHPIKGTRPRHQDPIEDQLQLSQLKNSEKDKAENVMIVDLLRNDLGRICENGSVITEKLFATESFPNVHHLVSTVTGKLKAQLPLQDLFRAIFPGGSITGAPKVRAMEIIEELEPHRRSIYCGSLVYLGGNGSIDSNIAIRTLLKIDNEIYCWGGGGIVADSDCDKEHQESLDKVGKLMGILEEQFS